LKVQGFINQQNFSEVLHNKIYKPTEIGELVCQMYFKPSTAADLYRRLKFLSGLGNKKEHNFKINEITILYIIALSHELLGGYYRNSEYNLIKSLYRKYKKNLDMFQYEFNIDENNSVFEDIEALKQTFILAEWITESSEVNIAENFGIGLGDLHRYVETANWLARGVYQFSKLIKDDKLLKLTENLNIRIRYGVKKELIKFVGLKGIGRIRARVLYQNGIMSINQLYETPNEELERISSQISKNLIISLKEQIKSDRQVLNQNIEQSDAFDDMYNNGLQNNIKVIGSSPKKTKKSKTKQTYLI
jgi:helicase